LTHDDQIKLGDLGYSRLNERDSELTADIGTFGYKSPEIINGEYSFNTDIWLAIFISLKTRCTHFTIQSGCKS
jgi:serine/threonine protein kinase